MDIPKRSETGLKPSETVRKAAISADPTFVWKFVGVPKRSETSLKPSEIVWKFVDVPKRSETGLKP